MTCKNWGFILILILFLCVSTVNAADNGTDDTVSSVDGNSLEYVNVSSSSGENDV